MLRINLINKTSVGYRHGLRLAKRRLTYAANPEKFIVRSGNWSAANPEYNKQWQNNNRDITRQASTAWKTANPQKVREYVNNKRKIDLQFKLAELLRIRLYGALKAKNARKTSSAVRDLGCTIPELRIHLEKQFKPGMTWENQGEWEIDHIRPLASFTLTDPEQQKIACHFTNLQPLWWRDNLSKSDRWAA